MRTSLLCLLTFLIIGFAKAQSPTITSASEAVPGDVNPYTSVQTIGTAAPPTGANVTWDYSALIDSGGYTVDSFLSPSATPYAALFAGTNLALPIGINGGYAYYKTTTSDWGELGGILPGANADTVYFPNLQNQFHFPFSYGSTYLDSSQQISYTKFGRDTFEYTVYHQGVGYGTLKIPGKSAYTNVLMVKTIGIQRSTFLTFSFSDTTTTIYFVSPGVRSYIMQMQLNNEDQVTNAKYLIANVIVPPTSYTFNGNGDWNNSANWSGSAVPTSPVPPGTQVTITPQAGGSCTLNVQVIFSAGSTLTVTTGAVFNVMNNLIINK